MHLRTVNSGRLLAVFLGVLCTIGTMAQRPDSTFWVPNGPVETLLLHDTTVIIGGAFDQVSPVTGNFIRTNTVNGEPDLTLFKINGPVYATCVDTFGYIYVGGSFSRAGNTNVQNLFRLTPAGVFDHSFIPSVDGPVYSLCTFKFDLYIGGDFSTIDGEMRGNCASINISTDSLNSFDADTDGPVYCMAVDTLFGGLIIGGDFAAVGSFSPPFLAKVDIEAGWPITFGSVPWTASPNCNGPVYDIELSGNALFIAGEFTHLGPITCLGLAKLQRSNGAVIATNANVVGQVYTIEIIDSSVFIGGSFNSVGLQARQNLACVDLDFALQSWAPSASGTVHTIRKLDSIRLAIGGDFLLMNGDSCGRAALINSTDSGSLFVWNPMFNGTVRTIIADVSGRLYAGGDFFGMGGEFRNNLCALSVNSGVVTAWNPKVNNAVHTMSLDDDSLYFAGDFTSVNGNTRGRIAAIDLGTSALLPFNPGVNGWVRTIAITDSSLYFGGNFTTLGGQARMNIGKVDKFTGAATSWNPGCAGTVNSILPASNWIYVAGFYSTIAGFGRENLARLDPASGIADWNWICDTDDGIYHAEFYNGKLALGGWFSTVNGQTAPDFAFVDTLSLQVTATTFSCDGFVRTFTTYGDDFFLSGVYDVVNNQYHPRLVAYDEGNAVVDPWTPAPNAAPLAMEVTASRIFLGGAMSTTAGAFHPFLQVLDIQWVTPVEEHTAVSSAFEIYPVPASDNVTIITGADATQYTITDVTGKTVQAGALNLQNGRTEISVGELAGGLYILTVYGAGAPLSRRMIIE